VKPKLVLKGVVFTVIMQGALDAALAPVAIPTFAAPLEHFQAKWTPVRVKKMR
jgi:urea transporter